MAIFNVTLMKDFSRCFLQLQTINVVSHVFNIRSLLLFTDKKCHFSNKARNRAHYY